MSVTKRNGKWQVKYRLNGKQRYRTFDRKADAETWEADYKQRRQLGPRLAVQHDRENATLIEYVRGPWRAHAVTLAKPTKAKYEWAIQKHLVELVDQPLILIDAPMVASHQRLMLHKGATPSTVREVMAKLSGILQIATEHGYLAANPVRAVRNVPADHADEIDPLSPVELERLLLRLGGRDRAIAQLGGHFGLRPLEIRKVPWTALGDGTLTIGRAQTKATARRARVITGPTIGIRELRAWQLESGGRGPDPIIGPMSPDAMRLWNRRVLRPAVAQVTDGRITNATAKLLRHSHASACHYVATLTQPQILRRLSHGPQVHHQHYAHVIDGIDGERYASLDELITRARQETSRPISGGHKMVTEPVRTA
jgi:integrase